LLFMKISKFENKNLTVKLGIAFLNI